MTENRSHLYKGLPCIWDGSRYVVFSPFAFMLARLSSADLNDPEVDRELCRLNFFGRPCSQDDCPELIKVTLVITNECNLRCKYCYIDAGDNMRQNMNSQLAVNAVKGMIKRKPNARKIYVAFFGGEPTLNMNVIEQVVEFVKSTRLQSTFHISTNGIFCDKVLGFLSDNIFDVTISSDGTPETNNRYRIFANGAGTARDVENTIRKLVQKRVHFNVRMTVTERNVDSIPEAIEYFSSLGVKFVHLELVREQGRARRNGVKPPNLKVYVEYFKQGIEKSEQKGIFIINSVLMNILTPSIYFCSSARGDMYVVTPTGNISLCYEIQNSSRLYSDFVIGKVKGDEIQVDNSKLSRLHHVDVDRMKHCSNCFAKYICGGGCPLRNLIAAGDMLGFSPEMCTMRRDIVHDSILRLYYASKSGRLSPVMGCAVYENPRLLYEWS